MPEIPYMQWYCNDWIGDPFVTSLTPQTRAIWFDWLNVMHLTGRSGVLRGTIDQLSRWGRCNAFQAQAAISEIASIETDLATDEAGTYTIRNRRMMREDDERKSSRERQLQYRERKKSESVTPLSREKNAPRAYGAGVGGSYNQQREGGVGETTAPEEQPLSPDLEEIGDWLTRVPKVSGSEKLRDAIIEHGHTTESLKALWANVVNTPKVRDRKAFFVSQIQGGAKAVTA